MVALVIISYFVFITNAEKIVKEIVTHYTKGTMKIEMKKLKFNLRELRITIDHSEISTIDSTHQNATYNIKVDTIVLELAHIRPLLLHRKLYIDSITFKRPSISIVQWKELKKEKFSLPQQMGKVYNSLNSTLDMLSIKYCLIDSGAFSIEDKVHPERKKVAVTDFYFLIDNLHKTSSLNKDDRFFFSDRIKFYSSHQNITLASGNQQISYSRLRINSARKIIELDSCYVFSKKSNSDFNSFSGYFDTLKFTNVDFQKLTQENILDADSAYCIQPKIILKTSIKEKKTDGMLAHAMSRDSFTVLMKYLLGNFNIDYIGVDKAAIEIQTKSDSKISSYQIKRTDFSMHDVSVVDHPDSTIKVGSFDLGLIGYQAYDPDSSYLVKFDSIHFVNEEIFLSNFKISPVRKIQSNEFKDISMSSLAINGISWIDLLANRKIVANDIELINPELDLRLSTNKKNENPKKKKVTLLAAFKNVTEYADVENLKIRNAQFQMHQGDKLVRLTNLNCTVPVNRLLKSRTFNDFLAASVFVDFESAKINIKQHQFLLKKGKYNGHESSLLIKEALVDDDKNLFHGYFQNLNIHKPSEILPDHFDFSSLSWDKATLSFSTNPSANKIDELKPRPLLTVASIQGNNTVFQIKGIAFSTNGVLPEIDISKFTRETNGQIIVKDIKFKGNKISMVNKGMRLMINQLDFQNKITSSITGLFLNADSGKKKITLNIPKFDFSADINDLIKKQFVLGDLFIKEPTVSILNNDSFQSNPDISRASKFPEIKISSIGINNPEIHEAVFDEKFQPYLNQIQSSIQLNDIVLKEDNIQIKNGNIQLADLKFTTPKISFSIPVDDPMKISVKDIGLSLGDPQEKLKWSFLIDTLSSNSLLLKTSKDSSHSQEIIIRNTSLSSIQINNSNGFTPYELFSSSPDFSIQTSVDISNNQSRFHIQNLNFKNKTRDLKIDSFGFRPLAEKFDFVKMNDYQKDYPVFSTGVIKVNNFNLLKLFKDSVFMAADVSVSRPDLYIFKDKRKPFKKGIYKPLPSALLKKVNFKFDIDSLHINDGAIVYEELNEKTNKSGVVKFSHLDALVNNFKNHNHIETDSLRLYVTGNFMDSAKIRFRLAESFTDSLHTFTYGLRFRSFDFKILNPILEPLVSARIISGSLDTLRVNAIGREHMSHGKMKMYYNDLKIQYLNKGSDSVKNLKSRLINFVANDLLLKRNNKKGIGIVYAERDKERGFANYWLKIGLSGVVSSSGVKKNKKVEKIYRNKLKKLKVPDIPDVDL